MQKIIAIKKIEVAAIQVKAELQSGRIYFQVFQLDGVISSWLKSN